MRNDKGVFFVVFLLLTVLTVNKSYADVPTPQADGRAELIENELQAAAKRAELSSQEQTQENFRKIETTIENDMNSTKNLDEGSFDKEMPVSHEQVISSKETVSDNEIAADQESFENYKKGPHQFELGTEAYSYKYTERIGVKTTGIKGGLVGAYQYRFSENDVIGSWNDFLHEKNKVNIFRFEGRLSYGAVDYEGSGTWGGIPDWNFETRGLVGMEVPLANKILMTPYGGLGYRYLFNKSSIMPSRSIDGSLYYSGYDRESHYIYIPLGLEAQRELMQDWSLSVKGEFDYLVWGKQISHLENMVDDADVNGGYDRLENTQKHGMGWRTSARLTKKTGSLDVFVEPFIRYWHIKDSEFSFVTAGGALICSGSLCSGGIEPDNKTWEYGVNLGAKF